MEAKELIVTFEMMRDKTEGEFVVVIPSDGPPYLKSMKNVVQVRVREPK